MRKIWLDTDPGFDDWLTMLLLQADTALDWLGTSVVAGNAPLEATLDNALRIQQHFALTAPIYAGCERPLMGRSETAQNILGVQGMRSTGVPLPATTLVPEGTHAVHALIDAVRRHPGEITIVAIAPLTNIATALAQAPDIAPLIAEIVLMGGSTDQGNHTAAAEFNIYADPEAANRVFRSGVPLRMFGLNLCRQIRIRQTEVQRIQSIGKPRADWMAGYLDAYQRIASADGALPMPLYDPVVALYLAWPELFQFQSAHVDIELAGTYTRGMTVCEFRVPRRAPPNAEVAMSIDGPRALGLLMDRLAALLS
ncbi:nucleoside hydrolase [Rhodoferax sp.]|uniref:nucleoside hydrolase n=1 Tax=Rhodoferax sp. TaxID=50421 RepID=UPI00374D8EF1